MYIPITKIHGSLELELELVDWHFFNIKHARYHKFKEKTSILKYNFLLYCKDRAVLHRFENVYILALLQKGSCNQFFMLGKKKSGNTAKVNY